MESVLGIEISEDKIKFLEARATEKGWQLLRMDNLDLSAGSLKEGVIAEPKQISEKISVFVKKNKISAKKAIALIESPHIFTRLIRLPYNLTDEQIRLNLQAEVNQYQAFSGKNNIIGFKKVEEINEEGIKKVNVLFVTVSRAVAESYLKTMELAGFNLMGIDTPVFSVTRLLENVDFEPSSLEVTLLMLIGNKYLDTCIIKGNRPRFLHSIEAENNDFANKKEASVDKIASALKLILSFYQTRFMQGEEVAQIVINPMIKGFDNIHTLLQERIPQIPIKISHPLNKNYIVEKDNIANLEELKFSFSGILGAVLRLENKNLPYNFNLLLEQKSQRQYHFNQIQLLLVFLSAILTAAVISFIGINFRIGTLQKKIIQLSSKYDRFSLELKSVLSAKEKRDILGKISIEASEIIKSTKKADSFNSIAKAMVLALNDLWLTDIAFEQDKGYLFLTGQSLSEKLVFDYISSLSGCGFFGSVEINSSKNESEKIKFIIKCAAK